MLVVAVRDWARRTDSRMVSLGAKVEGAPRMAEGRTPHREEIRDQERLAVHAGEVRIALGVLGLAATFVLEGLEVYRALAIGYLGLALAFQWIIRRRLLRTTLRTVAMGFIDMGVLSVFVQRLGSATSTLPIVYVAAPVLYATTTQRQRVSVLVAAFGVLGYVTLHALELASVLPYAPGSPGAVPPDVTTRAANVLLITICTGGTSLLTSQLIKALAAANARLRDLSQHDELSGLYNRRYVMQPQEDELARLRRKPSALTVAMVDLDGFKRVNDEIGHEAGDAVLKAVAAALLSATRKIDVVARYGGDEFVILFPNTEPEGARAVSTRILDQTREAARAACPSIPVTASIGSTVVLAGDEPAEVIRRVDEQLYAAKRAGGDRVYTG
jgi:diguanylate cyclase (GGDEF)-like protein